MGTACAVGRRNEPRGGIIGIDGKGCAHHYHGPANSVVVYDQYTGELHGVIYLGAKTLAQHHLETAEIRGWRDTSNELKPVLYVEADAKRAAAGDAR